MATQANRLIDGTQMTASVGTGKLGGGGVGEKGKTTHGCGQDFGDCWGERVKGTKW